MMTSTFNLLLLTVLSGWFSTMGSCTQLFPRENIPSLPGKLGPAPEQGVAMQYNTTDMFRQVLKTLELLREDDGSLESVMQDSTLIARLCPEQCTGRCTCPVEHDVKTLDVEHVYKCAKQCQHLPHEHTSYLEDDYGQCLVPCLSRKSPEQLRVLNGGNTYKPEYFPTPTDPIFETTFIPTLNAASFPSTNFDPDVEVQMHNRVAVAPAMTATALVITDTLLIETVVTATIGDELATITLQSLSNFEGLDGLANQTSRVYGNATTTLALTTARGSGRPGLATDLPEFSDDAAIVGNGPKGFILLAVLTGLGALVF